MNSPLASAHKRAHRSVEEDEIADEGGIAKICQLNNTRLPSRVCHVKIPNQRPGKLRIHLEREKSEAKVLINFSVENFRSFGAEQTLNLVASGRFKDHPDHCVAIDNTDKSVLRAAVVYGANAAGKSNLVRAIDFAQDVILGRERFNNLAAHQFRFCNDKGPSSFEFRFVVAGQLFVYGFAITPKAVVQEWLEATTDNGRDVEIFSREGQNISTGNLKPFGDEGTVSAEALRALEKLGARRNQLLLNKIVDLEESRRGELLDRCARWFENCLTIIQPAAVFAPLLDFLAEDDHFRHFAGEFLRNAGTGIDDLQVEESRVSTDRFPKELLEGLLPAHDEEAGITLHGLAVNLRLDPEDPAKVIRRNLAARHHVRESEFSIPFGDESDGTQRCLNLLPALFHLANRSKVFVIDELDRSLHPLLAHALVKLFVESCSGAHQQMIVTTHETHLLDQDLLRRDEIWFVEKDANQQSQLYSLADLSIRNDLRIEKGYLQGRFGGIPFIGDTKKLIDMIQCPSGS